MKVIWASLAGALGWAFGASVPYLIVLFTLICIDTILGVVNARKNGGITSRGFSRLFKKSIFYAGSIVAVNLAITTLGILPGALVVLVYALIGCEALSIIEHWRISGYMPEGVEAIIKRITGAIKDERNSTATS